MHATDYNGRRMKLIMLIIEETVIEEIKIVRYCHLMGSIANVNGVPLLFECPEGQREENNV